MAEQELVGIGAAGIDFHAAVTAFETADGEAVGHHSFGGLLGVVGDGHGGVETAGAAYIELAFGFAVEVEQVVAVQFAFFQAEGAGHAGLFVGGDEGLEGAVLGGLASEDGHDGGHAHTVVGTEGGVAGVNPVADYLGLDGVFLKVVFLAGTGLGHHVHVGLQHYGMDFLHAFGGGLAEDDVANAVDAACNLVFLCPVDNESTHFFFVFRGTRLASEGVEVAPQLFGFKVFDCHDVWFVC